MSKRSLWFVLPMALFTACSSSSSQDDGDPSNGPLDAVPDALTESAKGPTDHPGSSTEVWAVQNQWTDTATAAANAAGIAWEANSGLTWEAKYGKWLASFEVIRNSDDSNDTIQVNTPYGGKKIAPPSLECAETAMALRGLFASWYHLPFFMTGWDDKGKRPLYAGHFGFVDGSGQGISGFPRFHDQYQDKEASWHAGDTWPKDAKLRSLHLGPGDDVAFLEPGAGAGAWFDEVALNKRVGYFLRLLLVYFGSVNLADPSNLFNIQPEATAPGDVLLERWQKNGIGHTIPVFRVDTVNGKPAPYVATGSMPRRQAVWTAPIDNRHYFISDETGGVGNAGDGNPYAKLGGGIHRWRVATLKGSVWNNVVLPNDASAYIAATDTAAIAARPKKFDDTLAFGTAQDRKVAALQMIDTARTKLNQLPASCSSRTLREDGFRILYGALSELEQKDESAVDKQYRKLEDYVFGELEYTKSKTCCWNTTTPAMAAVILDAAKAEQAKAAANNTCVQPTIFKAAGGGDGYSSWAQHAKDMGRQADWRAWSEDEPCAQRATAEDTTTWRGSPDYCSVFGPAPVTPAPTPNGAP
jgi:hypothetical protein